MDRVQVSAPREAPPEWAKPTVETVYKITPAQRKFLLNLIEERDAGPDPEGKIDLIMKCLRISEDPEEFGMGKKKASELITWFLTRPKKPKAAVVTDGIATTADLSGLPAGRYAIENELGDGPELRFYQCWESRDKTTKRLYVMFGPYEGRLPYAAQQAVANAIVARGVRECAIRYGMEIGSCSNCGRRLTNRISRELGIGPICGGRMFGDDFKTEVKNKRAELSAQGINPDEEVE